jgi:RND family efflux transporter MFP subunit
MLLSIAGCGDKAEVASPAAASSSATGSASAPGSAASAPTVSVTLVRAQKRDWPVLLKATGTVTSLTSVEVRPQVSSIVTQVHFREGQFVKAGQLLFTLDSRGEEANVAKARAQLAKDKAALDDAQRQAARARQLLAQNFISQGALDTSTTQVDSLAATVAADQAALDASRVALSYYRISAPHAGRAGAVNVFAGTAVQANQSALVTITQLDPIGVAFNLPQSSLSDALSSLADGGASVTAALADGTGTFKGKLKFVDNAVDAGSGTLKVKAVFDNHDGKLWPGAFVEVNQTVTVLKDAVVIPQASIIQGARGATVYVMENGKAVMKPIKLVHAQHNEAAVTGVKTGDAVVLDGRQNVRPGSSIAERAREPSGAASGAARTASAGRAGATLPATP